MFDLFRSRAKIVKYFLGALLLLVALSMVITLIPGFGGFGGSTRTESQVVAEIGNYVLPLTELQRSIKAQLRGKSVPAGMAEALIPEFANQLINQYAMVYQAERLGFQVSEADLAAAIRDTFPQLFNGDRFAGSEAYAALLAQQNLTISEFESSLRKQLLLDDLLRLAVGGIGVSQPELEAEFHRKNDRVKIEYVAISGVKYRSEAVVKPEEIQEYFDKHRSDYQIPEKRSLEALIVDEAKIGQSISVPEAELRRAYDLNKDAYRMPQRVHVRHILLKTTDKPKEEVAKIKAKADELLKQLKQGAKFEDLARKNSEDTATAPKGGDLDWIVRGQTVKAFEDAAFSLGPGQISNVITTEYGFHIIQVLEKQEAHLRPFDEVKAQLAEEHKKQLVYDRMQELSDQARAALNQDPRAAEKIARELNLQLVKAEKAGTGDPIPEIGINQEFNEAIASLRRGEVTPIAQVGSSKLAVAVVTEVFPARQAEVAEARNEIYGLLMTEKLKQIVDSRAREALEKAKSLNGDLKKTAQAMGLDFKTPPEFARDTLVEGLGAAKYVEQAFTLPAGEVFGPVAMDIQRFVCKVVAKTPADMSQLAAQRDTLLEQIKSDKASQRMELLREGLRNRLLKEGKLKIHQDVINRYVSNYRGS